VDAAVSAENWQPVHAFAAVRRSVALGHEFIDPRTVVTAAETPEAAAIKARALELYEGAWGSGWRSTFVCVVEILLVPVRRVDTVDTVDGGAAVKP
jgi:hypothetical protein